MQDIVKVMTVFSQTTGLNCQLNENGIGTQTDIIAVHTPQVNYKEFYIIDFFCDLARVTKDIYSLHLFLLRRDCIDTRWWWWYKMELLEDSDQRGRKKRRNSCLGW